MVKRGNPNKKLLKKLDQIEKNFRIDLKVTIFLSVLLSFMGGIVVSNLFFLKGAASGSPTFWYDLIYFVVITVIFVITFNFVINNLDKIRDFIKRNY